MARQLNASQTLRRLVSTSAVAVVTCGVIGTVAGFFGAGLAGVYSGLCALVLGILMLLITAFTHSKCLANKDFMMAWMGMDFLGKFVLLGFGLFAVKRLTAWDVKTLGLTLIAILIVTSFTGMYAVMTSNVKLLDQPEEDK